MGNRINRLLYNLMPEDVVESDYQLYAKGLDRTSGTRILLPNRLAELLVHARNDVFSSDDCAVSREVGGNNYLFVFPEGNVFVPHPLRALALGGTYNSFLEIEGLTKDRVYALADRFGLPKSNEEVIQIMQR